MGYFVGDGEVQIPGKRRRSGSGSPGLGPGEGLRAGQSSSGVGVGNAFLMLPRRCCGCYAGTSSTRGGFSSKDVWLQTIMAILPGSKWSCPLLRMVFTRRT